MDGCNKTPHNAHSQSDTHLFNIQLYQGTKLVSVFLLVPKKDVEPGGAGHPWC